MCVLSAVSCIHFTSIWSRGRGVRIEGAAISNIIEIESRVHLVVRTGHGRRVIARDFGLDTHHLRITNIYFKSVHLVGQIQIA